MEGTPWRYSRINNDEWLFPTACLTWIKRYFTSPYNCGMVLLDYLWPVRIEASDTQGRFLTHRGAEATFAQSTRTHTFLKTIYTLSCWYPLDRSRRVLSDECPCARVSVISQCCASFCIGIISHQRHKGQILSTPIICMNLVDWNPNQWPCGALADCCTRSWVTRLDNLFINNSCYFESPTALADYSSISWMTRLNNLFI